MSVDNPFFFTKRHKFKDTLALFIIFLSFNHLASLCLLLLFILATNLNNLLTDSFIYAFLWKRPAPKIRDVSQFDKLLKMGNNYTNFRMFNLIPTNSNSNSNTVTSNNNISNTNSMAANATTGSTTVTNNSSIPNTNTNTTTSINNNSNNNINNYNYMMSNNNINKDNNTLRDMKDSRDKNFNFANFSLYSNFFIVELILATLTRVYGAKFFINPVEIFSLSIIASFLINDPLDCVNYATTCTILYAVSLNMLKRLKYNFFKVNNFIDYNNNTNITTSAANTFSNNMFLGKNNFTNSTVILWENIDQINVIYLIFSFLKKIFFWDELWKLLLNYLHLRSNNNHSHNNTTSYSTNQNHHNKNFNHNHINNNNQSFNVKIGNTTLEILNSLIVSGTNSQNSNYLKKDCFFNNILVSKYIDIIHFYLSFHIIWCFFWERQFNIQKINDIIFKNNNNNTNNNININTKPPNLHSIINNKIITTDLFLNESLFNLNSIKPFFTSLVKSIRTLEPEVNINDINISNKNTSNNISRNNNNNNSGTSTTNNYANTLTFTNQLYELNVDLNDITNRIENNHDNKSNRNNSNNSSNRKNNNNTSNHTLDEINILEKDITLTTNLETFIRFLFKRDFAHRLAPIWSFLITLKTTRFERKHISSSSSYNNIQDNIIINDSSIDDNTTTATTNNNDNSTFVTNSLFSNIDSNDMALIAQNRNDDDFNQLNLINTNNMNFWFNSKDQNNHKICIMDIDTNTITFHLENLLMGELIVLVNGLIWSEVSYALILENVGEQYVVVNGLVPSCSYDIQFINRLDGKNDFLISDLVIRTKSITDKKNDLENNNATNNNNSNSSSSNKHNITRPFERLDSSFPSYYHRKFLSPLLTLKHSVLTTNANLLEERAKLKKTRKEVTKKLNSLRQDIDSLKNKIKQNENNDEKTLVKVENLKNLIQQNENSICRLEDNLKTKLQFQNQLEEKYLNHKDINLQKQLEFSKIREELELENKNLKEQEAKLIQELKQLNQKKEKLDTRNIKLTNELKQSNEIFDKIKLDYINKRRKDRLKRAEIKAREVNELELTIKALEQDVNRIEYENNNIKSLLLNYQK